MMDRNEFLDLLADEPIIASVKDDEGLESALKSDARVIFLLYGNVISISRLVACAHEAHKAVFVHLDMVDGLASREVSVDFIARDTKADGIISTKSQLTRRARELGLVAVERFFLLDSMAISNIEKSHLSDTCDLIELLPGLMPKIIRQVADKVNRPIIVGGLINEKPDITAALDAGAVAVSSTNPDVWKM